MDFEQLNSYSFRSLKSMAVDMGLKTHRSKQETINAIILALKEYEEYKTQKVDKYTKVKQLGEKGKEGTTYLVTTTDGQEFAMKTFRKQKSSSTLRKESELQQMASAFGISPNVIDVDTVSKYIVMEKMDKHLIDVMKKQKGTLSKSQQQQIVKIFQKLDQARVFHGDSNILNYMYKGRKLYIIDFGMAKEVNSSLVRKLGTDTPNICIMTLGLILKLKELKCSRTSYEYLLPYINPSERERFKL